MIAVDIKNLSKSFAGVSILKSVNLSIEAGKIIGLVGRNGSGKSVMMKCIAGLIRPTAGHIEVFGKRVGQDVDFAPRTGISIEQPGLLLKKSAMGNMRALASLTGKPQNEEIRRLLDMVELSTSDRKAVGKYSMGMKQRLSIAMALLGDPDLLLLDEPMSNLDPTGADRMRKMLIGLAADGKTIMIATHVVEDVTGLCDRVCRFSDGMVDFTV